METPCAEDRARRSRRARWVVSVDKAREDYGVVMILDRVVDAKATRAIRGEAGAS